MQIPIRWSPKYTQEKLIIIEKNAWDKLWTYELKKLEVHVTVLGGFLLKEIYYQAKWYLRSMNVES
jgi:hypothetical protein